MGLEKHRSGGGDNCTKSMSGGGVYYEGELSREEGPLRCGCCLRRLGRKDCCLGR